MENQSLESQTLQQNNQKMQGKIALYALIGIVIIGSAFLAGLFKKNYPPEPSEFQTVAGTCCDTGDGDACKPITDANKTFVYPSGSGTKYGLLKSDITLQEEIYHLKDSGEKFDGHPIIINTTEAYSKNSGECGQGKYDQIWGANGCVPIPHGEIVYVCQKDCVPAAAGIYGCGTGDIYCYGTDKSVYDAYFRLSDYPTPGVPDAIKNCSKAVPSGDAPGEKHIVFAPTSSQQNLQLQTFSVVQTAGAIPWLSPYCKPAIYLYPPKPTTVTVKIAPKGNLTLTIPKYPTATGWQVLANPDGTIESNGTDYPYLYYEAQIPNNEINQQATTGFVVADSDLESFFTETLPKLGLNAKETTDFTNYWTKALPKTAYYKITVVPERLINEVSPLTISPKPDTEIRLTLYFTPLDKKVAINEPKLAAVERKGFTVVEWGGMFKKDKNHPFTCLM